MTRFFRLAAISVPLSLTLLALSACGEKGKDAAQGSAGGEVLEGSISDAMLPLDTVRSQPPLAPQSGAPGGKASGAGNASGGDSASESQAPAPEGGGDAPAAAPEAPAATPDAE